MYMYIYTYTNFFIHQRSLFYVIWVILPLLLLYCCYIIILSLLLKKIKTAKTNETNVWNVELQTVINFHFDAKICHKFSFQREKSCPLIDPTNIPRTSGMDQCCACWRMWGDGTWDAALCHLRALSFRPFLLIAALDASLLGRNS